MSCTTPSRCPKPRRPGLAARLALALELALLLLLLLPAAVTHAAAPADTMPFRVVYGRPEFTSEVGVTCYLWSEGGRLHLHLQPGSTRHRVHGQLRTSHTGAFRDVIPSSEEVLVKQANPSKLEFETESGRRGDDGLDVTLTGDFNQLTIDFFVDEARDPTAVRIGARRERPRGLPARLEVRGGDPSWLQRFGF